MEPTLDQVWDYVADCARSDHEFALSVKLRRGQPLDAWQRDDLIEAVRESQPLRSDSALARERALEQLRLMRALPVIDAASGQVVAR